ncbi:type II secretion system F family protein [Roseomonas sp. AR75]|uniref:type II secretion system F family protein n=1 Tax=Roseomonas sp. AR75 TaxID=2562311 RepID=UPI0010C0CE13|nr:type II secretion system F family protein [Roseomonas sp. AR75]
MSPLLAGLIAAGLLAIVAIALAANELTEHRMAERVRRAAIGVTPEAAPKRSFASMGASMLRLLDVSGLVRFMASQQDRVQVERTLVPLGVPATMAAPLLVALKLVFLVAGPAVAMAYHAANGSGGSPMLPLLVGAGVGVLAPNMILSQLRKRRVAALNRGMADTLDLLVVCAEAGLGLESAIDRVANDLRRANPAMSLEFAQLSQEMRLMPDRSSAMERFAERAEVDGLRRVAATLSQAMRYGTPLGTALRALAADERQARLIRMEEKAARLPALLVLPLILFILPPLFLVLVGPSILQLFDAVGAMQ